MAKKKSKIVKLKKVKEKKSGIMKALEAVVIVGALAAFIVKFLRGKKGK